VSALANKNILLGVSGGIAAYKAVQLASEFVQDQAHVEVMLTEAAQRFVSGMTFAAITHAPVHSDPFAPWTDSFSGHVTLAARADALIIAPATASTIARLALGLSDDLIGLVALSTSAPLVIAPAMEHGMYHHPATQQHLQTLASRGATIVGPESGRLASGAHGDGRMTSPGAIVDVVRNLLRSAGLLAGKRVVVTAGGTREPLDPVRYIGNHSSGRMGFAIAAAAIRQGGVVTLIAGPTALSAPPGAAIVDVETAADMQSAVERATDEADVLIMSAAVSDFRPESSAAGKIKKDQSPYFDLRLVQNPDILASINQPGLLKVGFAAETDDLLRNAAYKLKAKGLAMIVANDAAATIGSPDSTATFLFADGRVVQLPQMSKDDLAGEIVRAVAELLPSPERQAS
jgi:phosphopantothenoylcysteine decarboxylase / phosphopantothenate---cysteine ligase